MKALATIFICLWCCTQRAQSLTTAPSKSGLKESQVPTLVTNSFHGEYPGILPVWKMEGLYYKASFVDPKSNTATNVVYRNNGEIIRQEREMEKSEYPQLINEYFQKYFPGEGYVIWRRTDNFSNTTYFAVRNNRTLTFNKEGYYIGPRQDTIRPDEKIRVIGGTAD